MARYALVVGIANYDYSQYLQPLPKAVADAEAVAQILEQHGGFYKVERLPNRWIKEEQRFEVAPSQRVTADSMFDTIKAFLKEAQNHEALIYFAGHGFRTISRAGKQRGFLAASDTVNEKSAIALDDDLNVLISQSSLSSLVMLLDCCHAGALLEDMDLTRNVIEPSLSAFNAPRDYYLIAACRAGEVAREGAEHGLFTEALINGLSKKNANPENGHVSVNRLFDRIYQNLQRSGQEPFLIGGGRSLTLVTYPSESKAVPAIDENILPYQGLEPFEKEQAQFFFGRRQVVEGIWKALDQGSFVSVVGASGSGKSSAVRAGLIPWLEKGGWHILRPITPGTSPLARLETVFEPFFAGARGQKQLENFIHNHPRGLGQIIAKLPGEGRFLLLVDQFEEVFTLSHSDDQQRFIGLLTQTVDEPYLRLAIVTTMRGDFLEPCLEYPKLTKLIQNQAIFMPPLLGAELEQAILEPARKMGYSLESGVLGGILQDVGQESGCLPLLQFALLELWKRRDQSLRQLTRSAYQEMGGVPGALNRNAEHFYEHLDEVEQAWVKRICLKLVQTGTEEQDTRQRQSKQKLLALATDLESQQLINDILTEMVDLRLLATGEENGEAWVDLAHEALMKGWERFEDWRTQDRNLRRLVDRLERALQEWQKNPIEPI